MGNAEKAVNMTQEQIEMQIESFAKRDFECAVVYDWIYENFGANSFMARQVLNKASDRAKKVGIRTFTSIWKAYIKDKGDALKESRKIAATNSTAFPGQPLDLECGDYICDEFGVQVDMGFGTVTVCSHPITIKERLKNIDTGEEKLVIAYSRNAGTTWREAIYDMQTLATSRAIVGLASQGIDVNSESAKDLVKYIATIHNLNHAKIPERKTVARLGWVNGEGFSPFIAGLQYDTGGQFVNEYASVNQKGDEEVWMDLVKSVRAGRSIPARIALATAFASPLVHLLNGLPSITHLWGSVSGIGKSVGLKVAASVWANPEIGRYIKTTKATEVAMEQQASFCGNLPVILDELQLIQNNKDFDRIIYSLCEGSGKTRGSKFGGLQATTHWCNTLLTSGEQPITTATSKAGAVNRVIEVECTEKLFDDPRKVSTIIDNNYGFAGKRFVGMLDGLDEDDPFQKEEVHEARREAAMAHLNEVHERIYAELQQTGATDKQVLTASILLTAEVLTEEWLFKDGHALTVEDIKPYLLTQVQADTNRRAYAWLMDWIAANAMKFKPDMAADIRTDIWGRFRDENCKPCNDDNTEAHSCSIIKSMFNKVMTDAGFNPSSFESWAKKNGKIRLSKKGEASVVEKFGNVSTRCISVMLMTGDDDEDSKTAKSYTKVDADLPF